MGLSSEPLGLNLGPEPPERAIIRVVEDANKTLGRYNGMLVIQARKSKQRLLAA